MQDLLESLSGTSMYMQGWGWYTNLTKVSGIITKLVVELFIYVVWLSIGWVVSIADGSEHWIAETIPV
jgi:hypothetical protein